MSKKLETEPVYQNVFHDVAMLDSPTINITNNNGNNNTGFRICFNNNFATPINQPKKRVSGPTPKKNNNENNLQSDISCIDGNKLSIPLTNEYIPIKSEIFDRRTYTELPGIVSNTKYYIEYQQICTLGEGSFGKVYKCRNRNDGALYAIKKLKLNKNNKYRYNKTLREGKILCALSKYDKLCSNIIRYNSMWIEDDFLCISMEYCHNGKLSDKKGTTFINEDRLFEICFDMGNALSFLHSNNFIHFDIKPDNILISYNNIFKLCDFGLCMKIDRIDDDINIKKEISQNISMNTNNTCNDDDELKGNNNDNNNTCNNNANISKIKTEISEGDCRYICRELLEQNYSMKELDKVDIFSLGITLYELLTNKTLPKNGALWEKLRNNDLELNKYNKYSIKMIHLITKLLDSNPNKRPTSKELKDYYLKPYI